MYSGPGINIDANAPTESLTKTDDAIRAVFAWHESLGGSSRTPQAASLPGVNMQIHEPLSSPYSLEYSGGVARSFGRGTVRADLTYRSFRNFYALRTDLGTGTVADGVGIVTDNIFGAGRFRYVDELARMGADIRTESHHAVVRGRERLSGAPVRAPDIRAGAALVIAGLAADGETVISDARHIHRGYEDLVGKLKALGADIDLAD